MKTIIALILLVVFLLNCHDSNYKKQPMQTMMDDTIKPGDNSGYAAVNGLQMYYEIHGTGYPLVLIHGGGSTIQTSFGRILPTLARMNKVIAVEMQAHGHTADIDRPLSFEQDADDIAMLLQQLHIEKANIFGFSNGASTTLQFAIRHPGMANKIVVASTFYNKSGAPDWFWEMMQQPTFEGMPAAYKDAFLAINPDTNALHRMYERDVARMLSFPNISAWQMKAIKAPAIVIVGDKDVVTVEHAAEMHRLLKNSRLAILPGGHGEYMGEITTAQDSNLVAATASIITTFLLEPMPQQKE